MKHNIIFCFQTSRSSVALKTAKRAPSFSEGSLVWITFPCQLFVCRPEDTEQGGLVQSDREKKKENLYFLQRASGSKAIREATCSENWHERIKSKQRRKKGEIFHDWATPQEKVIWWKHLRHKYNIKVEKSLEIFKKKRSCFYRTKNTNCALNLCPYLRRSHWVEQAFSSSEYLNQLSVLTINQTFLHIFRRDEEISGFSSRIN